MGSCPECFHFNIRLRYSVSGVKGPLERKPTHASRKTTQNSTSLRPSSTSFPPHGCCLPFGSMVVVPVSAPWLLSRSRTPLRHQLASQSPDRRESTPFLALTTLSPKSKGFRTINPEVPQPFRVQEPHLIYGASPNRLSKSVSACNSWG